MKPLRYGEPGTSRFWSHGIRYELHITRAVRWADNLGREIPPAEWLALVEGDPELVPDPSNGKYAVLWSRKDRRVGTWFDWCAGNVYTADPDLPALKKVLELAQALRARVLGDDDTLFFKPGQALPLWNAP